MTVNKLTSPISQNDLINKTNEIIDNLGGGTGNISDVKVNGTSVVSDGVANIECIQKNGGSSSQTISLTSGSGTTALGLKSMSTSSYISLTGTNGWLGSYGVSSSKRAVFYNGVGYTLAYTSEIPINTSDLTNDSGFITGIGSSDVITALGYTPYNSTNPAGYTSNIGTVTSVNGIQPDSNGNVTISVSGGANTDLSNLTATGEAHFLKNTATGTNSLTVGGLSTTNGNSTNIGIGSAVNGDGSIAIGNGAVASAPYKAIQLGTGVNSTSFTFNVGFGYAEDQTTQINYQLLDGNTGYIPNERLLGLLQTIYPVGCVYLTTNSTCPLSALFGTWSLVSSGRALWTGTGSNGNTTIAAGLPNVTGSFGDNASAVKAVINGADGVGCFSSSTSASKKPFANGTGSSLTHLTKVIFNSSNSNTIYGNSTTVQPPAYVVNVFRRTA